MRVNSAVPDVAHKRLRRLQEVAPLLRATQLATEVAATVFSVGRRRILFVVALVFALVTIAPGPATSVMLSETAGPYEVTVGASPTPLKVGQGHFSVLVQKRSNALVVKDAGVTVEVTALDGEGPALTRQATHEQAADPRQYGAWVTFEAPGRQRVAVNVDGPEGPATVEFNVTVQRDFPARLVTYLGLISIPLGGVLLIVYWLRSGDGGDSGYPF